MQFRLRDWRFWVTEHRETLGVPLMILGVLFLLVLFGWDMLPFGPVSDGKGRILGLGFHEDYEGSRATASVEVEGKVVRIYLPTRHGCQVGDDIQLRSRTTRWGRVYGAAYVPRPCQR